MPQASNSFFRSEPVSVGGMPVGRRGGGHRLAPRIDHHHQPAAAHDELVDGVLRRLRQVLRLGHQQHLDVGIDHLRVERHRLHRDWSGAAASTTHRAGRRRRWPPRHHHRARIAIERQRRHHADHRALRVGQLVDQLGQVVFQEALALGLEERRWCARRPAGWCRPGRNRPARRPDRPARLAARRRARGPRCR